MVLHSMPPPSIIFLLLTLLIQTQEKLSYPSTWDIHICFEILEHFSLSSYSWLEIKALYEF